MRFLKEAHKTLNSITSLLKKIIVSAFFFQSPDTSSAINL